jgi:hypothetical protein
MNHRAMNEHSAVGPKSPDSQAAAAAHPNLRRVARECLHIVVPNMVSPVIRKTDI